MPAYVTLRPRLAGESAPLPARRFILALLLTLPSGCARDDRSPSAARPSSSPPSAPEAVWFETGTAPGQVVYPRAIAMDHRNGWFYLVDRQARVQRFDERGTYLAGWAMPDFRQGKPVGLSVGPDGNLWIADTHYHRVVVYSPDGALLRTFGSRGTGPGQFVYPTDIAFDEAGKRVFVSEYGDNDRIQVFTPEGQWLYSFGSFGQGDGQFSRPQSIAVRGNELFLTDACNHRLEVFTLDGKFVRTMGSAGDAPGQFRFPYGLELDAAGNLIVTEFGNNRVQKLTPDGKPLATWGTGGRLPGELANPWAAGFDRSGRLLVVDAGNNRVQIVKGLQ